MRHRLDGLVSLVGIAAFFTLHGSAAQADQTGTAGGVSPIDTMQPSLAIQFAVQDTGNFGGGVPVRMFAYEQSRWSSLNWAAADGRLVSRSLNPALFNQLGTSYGGDGISNFALPDLRGRTPVGDSPFLHAGQQRGQNSLTLSELELPAHTHTQPNVVGGVTGSAGVGLAYDNWQQSLSLNWAVETSGLFPNSSTYGFQDTVIGRVVPLAGQTSNSYTNTRVSADGQLVNNTLNPALYNQLGNNFGGTSTSFALPDLRERTARGVGNFNALGFTTGSSETTLINANLPSHTHTVGPLAPTSAVGGAVPVDNLQPSVGITYAIAITGAFPTTPLQENLPYIGEIQAFASTSLSSGYLPADGRLLSISQYSLLYQLLGTTYGGDGLGTFALPDLRNRVPIGASTEFPVGSVYGSDTYTLGLDNMPLHSHSYTLVPEPTAIAAILTPGLLMLRRRRR